jgi:cell division protein FtsL
MNKNIDGMWALTAIVWFIVGIMNLFSYFLTEDNMFFFVAILDMIVAVVCVWIGEWTYNVRQDFKKLRARVSESRKELNDLYNECGR